LKKAALLSIGCKTNQYETEALREELVGLGFEITDFSKKADVYIVNTCSVTAEAARKSKQMIRRAHGRDALICVMGCFSELNREEVGQMGSVRIVAGTDGRSKITSYLKNAFDTEDKYFIPSPKDIYENVRISSFSDKIRAYIKIEDGCDNFCSFCAIPYARGAVRSRDPLEIAQEARRLAENGFREVVVTGINICKYSYQDKNVIDILNILNDTEGIDRIRLGSIYPDFPDEKTADLLSRVDKLCPHFHISLQSGSTRILNDMNRKYSSGQAYENLHRLVGMSGDTLLTADIIVGFPGESEKDFSETYDFIESLPFYHTHVFRYSARKGTKASEMSGQVSAVTKNDRSGRLIGLSDKKKKQIILDHIGKKCKCVFEYCKDDIKHEFIGHTDNFIDVVSTGPYLLGSVYDVEMTGYENGNARAVIAT
jgi:threonylcarbamoyladenosine tRNA methylthiotransferase MtaB